MSALTRALEKALEAAGSPNEIADIARRAILALTNAHHALEEAETQFLFYQQQHRDKAARWQALPAEEQPPRKDIDNTRAKAAVNASFAVRMREARR